MTLTEFLLARFEEDVQACENVSNDVEWIGGRLVPFRDRLLAECEAKRRIVEEWQIGANRLDEQGRPAHLFDATASMLLKSHAGWLRILASVYSDHPDFDPAWRPWHAGRMGRA